jgi:hypothetical protein
MTPDLRAQRLIAVSLVVAIGVALWVRYQFMWLYGGGGDYLQWADTHYFGSISRFYVDAAIGLASGRGFPTLAYPPGYPFFLSLFVRAGAATPAAMRLLQIITDSLAVAAVFALMKACGLSATVAAVGAWAYALFPLWAAGAVFLLGESLAPALCVVVLLAVVGATGNGPARWAIAGVVTGAATLVRPDLLTLAVILALYAAVAPGIRRPRQFAAFAIGAALVLGSWGLRNRLVHGDWVFTSSSTGVALYEGLGDLPNPYGYVADDSVANHVLLDHGIRTGAGTPEGNRLLVSEYLRAAEQHPMHIVRAAAHRWRAILFSSDHLQPLYFGRLREWIDLAGLWLSIAAVIVVRRDGRKLLVIGAPVFSALLGIGLTHYEPRYVRYVQLAYLFAGLILFDRAWGLLKDRLSARVRVLMVAAGVSVAAIYSVKQLLDLHRDALAALRL